MPTLRPACGSKLLSVHGRPREGSTALSAALLALMILEGTRCKPGTTAVLAWLLLSVKGTPETLEGRQSLEKPEAEIGWCSVSIERGTPGGGVASGCPAGLTGWLDLRVHCFQYLPNGTLSVHKLPHFWEADSGHRLPHPGWGRGLSPNALISSACSERTVSWALRMALALGHSWEN